MSREPSGPARSPEEEEATAGERATGDATAVPVWGGDFGLAYGDAVPQGALLVVADGVPDEGSERGRRRAREGAACARLAEARATLEHRRADARATRDALAEARGAHLRAEDDYARALDLACATRLAERLADGAACLVCGATAHPGAAPWWPDLAGARAARDASEALVHAAATREAGAAAREEHAARDLARAEEDARAAAAAGRAEDDGR